MGGAGKGAAMGGEIYPCVGIVILGSGTSWSIFRIGIMGYVGINEKEGGWNPYNLPKSDLGGDVAGKQIREFGNTSSQRGIEGSWNADSGHIHSLQAGYDGAVGGFKTNI